MDDHVQTHGPQIPDGLPEHGEWVSPADESSGPLVDRLKTQLHPDRSDTVYLPEELQDFRAQAVRPGGDGEGPDIRV